MLHTRLESLYYYQLRALARALKLPYKGGRQALTAHILEMHSHPCCVRQVMLAVAAVEAEAERRGKRRRVENPAARSLDEQFAAVALSGLVGELSFESAGHSADGGGASAPPGARPEGASPVLLEVPTHLRYGWRSPVITAS